MSIIPLCLYSNNITNSSYIGYPLKENTKDGVVLRCGEKPDTFLVSQFYGIDPDIRPIPTSLDIICATDSEGSDFSTIKISQQYDPFNIDEKCVKFLAWLEPTPYTTPMYIFESGTGKIFISFSSTPPNNSFKEIVYSPIFVLTPSQQFNGTNFRFSLKDDRCVPDPNGESFENCIVKKTDEPSLLKSLEKKYKKHKDDKSLLLFFLFVTVIITLLFALHFSKRK